MAQLWPALFQRVDLAAGINSHFTELDRDSKIDPNFSHGLTQVGERTFRILARVAHHNVVTSTEHHLV